MSKQSPSRALLDAYMAQARLRKPLSREEEDRLARQYAATREPAVARQLVESNMLLVVKIACSYARTSEQILDLIQEGNIGLIGAVDRYDRNRGVRFTSFAKWWIRAHMLKYIISNERLVRVGTTEKQQRLYWSMPRMLSAALREGVDAADENRFIAERLGVSEEEVATMRGRLGASELSTETPMDSRTIGEHLTDGAPTAEGVLGEQQTVEALRAVLGYLKDRERDIIVSRWLCEQVETHEEIGRRYGITAERVRQIEARLLRHLRSRLNERLSNGICDDRASAEPAARRGRRSQGQTLRERAAA